jgi:putative inorganic carbon (hco3(-)) transporter
MMSQILDNGKLLRQAGIALIALLLGLAIALLPLSQLTLILLAVTAFAGVALIFAEPTFGLALTLLAGPFEPYESIMLHLPISAGQALLLITLGAWAARIIYQRRLGIHTGPLFWPLIAFLGIGALSFFAASSFELWIKECVKWAELLIVYLFTISQIKTNARARTFILGAILVSALFEAGLGIFQFGLRGVGPIEFLISGHYYRAYGTFEQPNPFGGYMGLTWPLAAAIGLFSLRQSLQHLSSPLRNSRGAWRSYALTLFSLLVGALGLVALGFSWSRGAWLGAIVAIVVMFIIVLRRPAASITIIALVAVCVIAFNMIDLLPISLRSRLTDFTQEFSSFDVRGIRINSSNYSVIERLAHWQAAQNMIVDHPWFGVGFGNYGAAYDHYRTVNWPIALGHAHNYYLNIWAETGIIGLLAYLVLWGSVFYRTIKTFYRRSDATSRGQGPRRNAANASPLIAAIALGMLGAWVQLSVHQTVDNLYVANIFLLIGAYFGIIDSLADSSHHAESLIQP